MSTYLSDYDYFLPEELIGQKPREPRDSAKLMLIDRKTGSIEHKNFYNIIDYLQKGDVLVRNATKVIPARIFGHKDTGGVLEILLIKRITLDTWECLLKPAKKLKLGQKLYIGENKELIGQKTRDPRDSAKLMLIDRKTGSIEHKNFYNIIDYLQKGDVLVRNATKVIPARIFGHKDTGGVLEILLIKRITLDTWECLLKPAKKLKLGQKLYIGENKELIAELLEIKEDGNRILKFYHEGSFEEILDKLGSMPLPPYITSKLENKDRYQTVYAQRGESVAAPTAGLHFTEELLKKILDKGVEIVDVFLEVGLGTFRPVQTENVLEHKMHEESFEISEKAAKIINEAKTEGRRIISVGTTATRALESSVDKNGKLIAQKKDTGIFIYPGYKFKIVDALITNFHLPKSTLLMLVSAFYDREKMLEIYNLAVKEKYHFFSFGDSMFIY